jgi:DNA replication protein DnaC
LEDILKLSTEKALSYEKFLESLLKHEIKSREQKKIEQRMKQALFPEYKTIDEFDIAEQQSLSRRQLNQLMELTWIEQGFNLILLGPPGVGKTHLAVGLGIHAIHNGYKVVFITMNDLVHYLKTQEILRSARARIKRILDADLVIIDDLMFMAMEKHEANLLFQLINKLYGQTSIIITSNKGPEDWGELLGDPAITTAILDRIVHKCEVINLCGDSYRLKYRASIFGKS